MITKLKHTPGIYLVGFMGAGKTTVGTRLADRLGWPFADLDDDIEARAGMPITRIFEEWGEAEFRRIEYECIKARVRQVESGRPLILALGGGAYAQPANADLLRDNGVTIWLDCPFEIARSRVENETHRPLARDPERFRELFEARRASYATAEYRVDAGGETDWVVDSIFGLKLL